MKIQNKIKVSVVMPIYNGEKILDLYLPQVLNQSLKEVNFVLVDNASTDKTLKLLKGYEVRDSRIKVLTIEENKGPGSARNLGLNYLKEHLELCGQYLWIPDLGDNFSPDFLLKMWTNAKLNQSDLVLSPCFVKYLINKGYWREFPLNYEKFYFDYSFSIDSLAPSEFFQFIKTSVWNKLYSSEFVFRHNLFFDVLPNCDDNTFVFLNFLLVQKISFFDETLMYYETSAKQIAEYNEEQNHKKNDFFLTELIKGYKSNNQEYVNTHLSSLSETLSNSFKFFDSCQKQMKKLDIWDKCKNIFQIWFIYLAKKCFLLISKELRSEFFGIFNHYCKELEITEEWIRNNNALNDYHKRIFNLAKEYRQHSE